MAEKMLKTIDVVSGATSKFMAGGLIGMSASPRVFGYTMDEWQVIGIISGIIVGLLGIAVNAWVRVKIGNQKRRATDH